MIIERSLHPDWLSNTYLVANEAGGKAIAIDAGGPSGPLFEAAERDGLEVTHLLLTHHHHDHIVEAPAWKERFGAKVLAHPLEAARVEGCDGTIEPGEELQVDGLSIVGLHTPGHTDGMLSFRVNDEHVFTGDTLFKGSVGGVKAPGSTSYADLKHSIMEVLMKLPPATQLHPGHTDPTTVGEEWEQNPFIRVWRGLDPEGADPCTVWERAATLVLWAPDYDGGHKAWIRWADTGEDDIVPGSQVVH
jgi:glyoxylase-like metal-dependent hydrolase (beta-lactamase superfamily II)